MEERQQDPTPRWKVGTKLFTRVTDSTGHNLIRACHITGYRVNATGVFYSARLAQPVIVLSNSRYYSSTVTKTMVSGSAAKFFTLTTEGKLELLDNIKARYEKLKAEAQVAFHNKCKAYDKERDDEIAKVTKELQGMS